MSPAILYRVFKKSVLRPSPVRTYLGLDVCCFFGCCYFFSKSNA